MKIKSIHLKNFKRFTDLHIHSVPASAKLIVVVGPNGCGKSSLFDAFLHWYRLSINIFSRQDEPYYKKDDQYLFDWRQNVKVELHENIPPKAGCLYVRTAYRNDPDFSVSQLNKPENPTGNNLFIQRRLIDDDKSVSQNYQRLVYETTAAVYNKNNDKKLILELREELIGQVRNSMQRVFGNLILNNISDPFSDGSFFFQKGTVQSYHYKNLSGGEKAAFDLLLDIHVKKKFFTDTVYCIDEIDAHLHTKIQGILVQEITNTIPDNSQLWITSHSLGVLRAAQKIEKASSGSVCIIDFDGVDSDMPGELTPAILGKVTWEKMLSITLDDLSNQVAPKFIVVCEGSSTGNRRKNFDADIYNKILGAHEPDVLFVSGGSSEEVKLTGNRLRVILSAVLPNTKVVSLVDRDDKSEEEVSEFEAQGNIVLKERNLESYLLDDTVITDLVKRENKPDSLSDALQIRDDALTKSTTRGNPENDLKSAAGEIYTGLKKLLNLRHPGNNTDAFMRDTLAPLIIPGTQVYQRLKSVIVDKILDI